MTDRYNTLTVIFEHNIREDDAKDILSAILQLKGVLSVAGNVSDAGEYMAEERAKYKLGQKLLKIIYPNLAS